MKTGTTPAPEAVVKTADMITGGVFLAEIV
jgi:hypothetical protein